MIRIRVWVTVSVLLLVCAFSTLAQPSPAQQAATSNAVVPTLVSFSGVLTDNNGRPLTGITGVTFSLYAEQQGGAPLWLETQNVQPDSTGHYSVMLGSSTSRGLPSSLFSSGEARWLGVQVQGQAEQPRVMLLSVPYAMKAGDAQTVGGLPASAFVLVEPGGSSGSSPSAPPNSGSPDNPALSGTGTTDFLPLWTNSTTLGDSVLFQSGTGSTAKVGINTTTPATTLDVKGNATVRGYLETPAITIATASAGSNSNPMVLVASSFNSSTSKAVTQNFVWQAEPVGNDTTTPSGTLNLLFGAGAAAPAETGLKLSNKGVLTFATGQTFPGTGTGTVTSVGSGSGLTGGPITGSGTLSVANAGVTNAMLQNSSVTLNASSAGGLTTPGAMTLGSAYTIGLAPCSPNQVLEYSGSSWNCATVGTGTVTSVGSGAGLTGGPITGSGTLSVATSGITNSMLQNSTFTLAANSPLTGGGTFSLGGSASLSLSSCGNGQVLEYVGGIWTCTSLSSGTITGVTAGTGLSGGGTSGNVTLSNTGLLGLTAGSGISVGSGQTPTVSVSGVPVLSGSNTFTGNNTFTAPATFTAGGSFSSSGTGVYAATTNFAYPAVNAYDNSGSTGVALQGISPGGSGVIGMTISGYGVTGEASGGVGVWGVDNDSGFGVEGDGVDGAVGVTSSSDTSYSLWATGGSQAGYFAGDVTVTGTLSKPGGSFKIDHPLDPANKYLYHSFVESPDMKNIYDGNVTTDRSGLATITLPDWFEVLNRDFRYQLTVIGQFAQAIVAHEIENNRFQIKTSLPNVKVSWQVTGIRQDAWANAHRIPLEVEKEDQAKGYYIYPELYGAPPEKQIEWALHPQQMKKLQENRQRAKQGLARRNQSSALTRGSAE